MTPRNGLERQQAIIELLDQPDSPDLRRGNRLTFDGRPDRYRLVPYFVSAFVQARLLDLQERETCRHAPPEAPV
jgi:hypothetical protein